MKLNLKEILNSETVRKQLPKFVISGGLGAGTDFLVYRLLLHFLSVSPSKAISFLCGTTLVFFMNKYWTYGKTAKSAPEIAKFALVYSVTWALNVGINREVLNLLPGHILWAFLAAAAVCTVISFCGQKWWVFK